VALHLRPGVREHYLGWLASARPDLLGLYEQRYGKRSNLPKADQTALSQLVRDRVERARGRSAHPASVSRGLETPAPPSSPAADQLTFGV